MFPGSHRNGSGSPNSGITMNMSGSISGHGNAPPSQQQLLPHHHPHFAMVGPHVENGGRLPHAMPHHRHHARHPSHQYPYFHSMPHHHYPGGPMVTMPHPISHNNNNVMMMSNALPRPTPTPTNHRVSSSTPSPSFRPPRHHHVLSAGAAPTNLAFSLSTDPHPPHVVDSASGQSFGRRSHHRDDDDDDEGELLEPATIVATTTATQWSPDFVPRPETRMDGMLPSSSSPSGITSRRYINKPPRSPDFYTSLPVRTCDRARTTEDSVSRDTISLVEHPPFTDGASNGTATSPPALHIRNISHAVSLETADKASRDLSPHQSSSQQRHSSPSNRRVSSDLSEVPPADQPHRLSLSAPRPIRPSISFKSPTTLNFERMIQASQLIAKDGTPRAKTVNSFHSENNTATKIISSTLFPDEAPSSAPQDANGPVKRPYKKRKLSSEEPDQDLDNDENEGLDDAPDVVDSNATFLEIPDYDPVRTCPATFIQNNVPVARCVVLLMALQRSEPTPAACEPGSAVRGLSLLPSVARKPEYNDDGFEIIPDGFFWRDYPVLEQVLIDAMPAFYGNANSLPQSSTQKLFNNRLVNRMRVAARTHKYVFGRTFALDAKKLRDRIRCYYKTHQQNAKKRLCTLLKKPDKPEHVEALRFLLDCVRTGKSLDDGRNPELPFKLRRIVTVGSSTGYAHDEL